MDKSSSPESVYAPKRSFTKATLAERVYESLREDILTNRLEPGVPLLEPRIAEAFGISRGPVREAIQRLAAEGLVDAIPRRGTVVSSLSREDFLDAYQVREALEVLAIRLATPRLSEEDLSVLEELQKKMRKQAEKHDVAGFFAANMTFHALLVEGSGNMKLQEVYSPLINQMRRYHLSSMALRGGLERSCDEHERILEAIKADDAEEAARLLGAHIRVPQQILESDEDVKLIPRTLLEVEVT